MNAATRISARLTEPADLITALPYLLGFHPRESLVVVALRPGSPPTVGLVLRSDLPPPGGEHELAQQLCAPLLARGTVAVLIVVIGGPPHPSPVMVALRTALEAAEVVVAHALWAESTAQGARWADLDEPGVGGVLADPTSSDLAAAATVAGVVAFATREDLARIVAPEADEILRRRAELIDAAVAAAEPDRGAASRAVRLQQVELLRAAVVAAADGQLPTTDDEVVRLAVALSDPVVRDSCLRWSTGEYATASERLWQVLTRMTPPPEAANPAALAALGAYLRGDGALAGIALARAEQAWPGHTLSTLLAQVISTAIPPRRLELFLRDAAAEAQALLSRGAP